MEKELEVAVGYEKVVSSKKKVDLPEVAKYYSKNDDGKFFARGIILFAILPKYKNNPTNSYTLIEVEINKQNYNDFVPTDDCKQKYWLTESGLRKTAFDIVTKSDYEFKEITAEEFEVKRIKLLNHFKAYTEEVLKNY